MKDLTLLVMAAGMGSRYGGLKQLDGVGPNNESIIDYSVYDAIKYGVNKIVFIIRKDFEEQFRSKISNKYIDKIQIKYAFQDIHDIPTRFDCPIAREKPWGTGHAILSAKDQINEPFIVINGDDYYGYDSFKVIVDYYYKNAGAQFCMVAFQLDKTLSSIGPVTRGVCTVKNNKLDTITEIEKIEKYRNTISSTSNIVLNGNEPASMNMWGFTPEIFSYLESGFSNFLLAEGNKLKSEYLIPTAVNDIVKNNYKQIHVLRSNASWFGVTYQKDKPFVVEKIQRLIESGVYRSPLFK